MPKGIYQHKKQSSETIKKRVEARKGYRHSEKTKRKMSEARKQNPIKYWLGKNIPIEMKIKNSLAKTGKKNPMYGKPSAMGMLGKKHSEETRKKMSEAKKGSKSHLWKGGITPLNEMIRHSIKYKMWREKVFKRDNYTCQNCGKRGNILHAHHIKHFATHRDLIFSLYNGITLCKICHKKVHNKKVDKQYATI